MKDAKNQFEKKHQLIVTVTKELQDRVGLLEIQNTDLGEKLRQCSEDLVKERVKVEQINEKKNLAEKEAKEDKQKLKQMEKKMAAEEGKLVHLTSQMGALESQLKIKDQVQDQRIKEMQKISKHTSDTVSRLEKEKIQLQLKVEELGNSLREKKEKAKKIIDELNAKLHKTDGRLTEEETSRKKLVQDLERAAQTIANIEKKRLELEHTVKHNSLSEEVKASMREVELMTDLRTTKDKLTSAEEVIASLTQDSEKLKEMIIKSEEQNQMLANYKDLEQKLKEEMAQKDEQIATLQIEMHELKNIISLSEEHSAMLENQVKELQEEVSQNDAQQKLSKLQQQVSEMESALNQVMTRNEELEAEMNLNTCEIEQRDRVMHEQNQVLKVRDELILLLKVKEQQQDKAISSLQATLEERDKNMEKVNKEIAIKSAELQELYSTLESKQVQVARLEKLVQQHEEQHDRSQKQRTRHEARIAELEETLQELRAPRYRQQQQPVSCVGIENTKYAYTSKIKGRNCFTERPCRDQDPPRRRTECTATHVTQHDTDPLVITNTQTDKHDLHNVCTDPPVGQKVTPKETPTKEQEHDIRHEIEQHSGGVPQTMSAHYSVTSIRLEEQNHNLHYTEESTKPTPPPQRKYLENMYKDDKHKQVTKDDQKYVSYSSSDELENSEYKEQIFKALESKENKIHWIQTQLVKSDGSDVSGSESELVEANESGFWFTNKKDCIDSKMCMEKIIKKIQVGATEEMGDHAKTKMMLPIKITPPKRCLQTHQKQMQNQDTHSQSVHSNTSSDHETTYVTNKDHVGMCKKQLDELDEVRISADLEEMSHSAPSLKGRFNSQSCGLNEQDWPSRTTHTERSYDTESESSEEERDVVTSSSILF
uniref:Uncharacterized protein n=1 Tax=Timema poppense TaxID=170557 RepID=A0A7R9DEA3_TIMPO|nr:unnamed protein product [Timema poppensis]